VEMLREAVLEAPCPAPPMSRALVRLAVVRAGRRRCGNWCWSCRASAALAGPSSPPNWSSLPPLRYSPTATATVVGRLHHHGADGGIDVDRFATPEAQLGRRLRGGVIGDRNPCLLGHPAALSSPRTACRAFNHLGQRRRIARRRRIHLEQRLAGPTHRPRSPHISAAAPAR